MLQYLVGSLSLIAVKVLTKIDKSVLRLSRGKITPGLSPLAMALILVNMIPLVSSENEQHCVLTLICILRNNAQFYSFVYLTISILDTGPLNTL